MKAAPLLLLSNVVVLGLCAYLFLQQQELQGQLAGPRADRARDGGAGVDAAILLARIEALEAEERAASVPAAATTPSARVEGGGGAAPVAAPRETGAAGAVDPGVWPDDSPEMALFRRRVARAVELNREEERKVAVLERVDELVAENKIAPLDAKQREVVAATLLNARDMAPEIFRKFRSPEMRDMSRDDRMAFIRTEFENLRADAKTSLENVVPAADAEVIVAEAVRGARGDGGDRGRGPRGGR